MLSQHFTPEQLREKLSYNPHTGELTWKKCRDSTKLGKPAKSIDVAGYIQVSMGVGKVLKGHRIAWVIYYGNWPEGHIDHINGVRSDNRIENLRVVNNEINCQNKRNGSCKNKTGFIGVHIGRGKTKIYRAKITVGDKQIHLGGYDTPEEAHQAYVEAKRRLHPGCAI